MPKPNIMNTQILALTLVSTVSISSIVNIPSALAQNENVYRCIMKKGFPTTVVNTKRGNIDLIVWKSSLFPGWSPLQRCQTITNRFQTFSEQGKLRYITNGKLNNQPVICVATNTPGKGFQCDRNGLLITLQPNDNPQKVMEELFDISARVRGGTPLVRSGKNQTFLDFDKLLSQVEINLDEMGDNEDTLPEQEITAPME